MFRTTSALLVALAVGPLAAAAPVPKSVKNAAALNGTWEVTEWHSAGNKVNSTYTLRWTIDGEKLDIERQANGNVRIAAPVNPPTYSLVKADKEGDQAVDYTISYTNGRTVTYPARYEIDGDTLKVCYEIRGGGRPADCTAGSSNVLYVFTRVKPDDK